MIGHDIIVIGASAGGVDAIVKLVRGLPANLEAAVFIVIHFPDTFKSHLPDILRRAGPLQVAHAQDNESIEPGRMYVAPPGKHLLIKPGHVSVTRGPKENRYRPAIDPLFRTAASVYGPRVIGVILTGALDDGTAGLWQVKERGGIAVVQDPAEAFSPTMPQNAISHVRVDYILPVTEISPLLAFLVQEPVVEPKSDSISQKLEMEIQTTEADKATLEDEEMIGSPSNLTCPECSGTLYELRDGNVARFRCRVGHAYSMDSLITGQSENLERVLWIALRTLEERATLIRRLVTHTKDRQRTLVASRFEQTLEEIERDMSLLRQILNKDEINIPDHVESN